MCKIFKGEGIHKGWKFLKGVMLLCAVKSELIYRQVSEIFKEWLYQFHSPGEFPWLTANSNQGLMNAGPSVYPQQNTGYLQRCDTKSQIVPMRNRSGRHVEKLAKQSKQLSNKTRFKVAICGRL